MTRGIASPWQERAPAPENPLEGAKEGEHPLRFNGRTYVVSVTLPFILPDERRAVGLASQTLGEALLALREQFPSFTSALEQQRLSLDEPSLNPSVSFDLGVVTLHAVASSTNEALARAMALDRLAIALSVLNATHPTSRDTLTSYRVSYARTR